MQEQWEQAMKALTCIRSSQGYTVLAENLGSRVYVNH